jgi:hypothetical protein
MVDRKVVPFDEFYYQLKLMYLFLLHVVCILNLHDFLVHSKYISFTEVTLYLLLVAKNKNS